MKTYINDKNIDINIDDNNSRKDNTMEKGLIIR